MSELIVSIKPATPADVLLLQQLSIITFTDTYAAYNTPENMQLFIDEHYDAALLLKELNDTAIQYFFAYANNQPAGYIKLRTTDEPAELAGTKHIEIERIYVLPAFKGKQIGRNLIDHVVDTATRQQYEILWLGVWDQNTNAMAFYKKLGFEVFGEHPFVLGTEPQRDWLMRKEL